jgi:hypothetical protein
MVMNGDLNLLTVFTLWGGSSFTEQEFGRQISHFHATVSSRKTPYRRHVMETNYFIVKFHVKLRQYKHQQTLLNVL